MKTFLRNVSIGLIVMAVLILGNLFIENSPSVLSRMIVIALDLIMAIIIDAFYV